ncbi:type VI secretion system Vgr family protein [Chitinophaga sp.]|uniref:type VI secretion system Vgr family protein n=1 Tax=Chitinophaga sp. TaxID=1869181 RepID=UPI002F931AB3
MSLYTRSSFSIGDHHFTSFHSLQLSQTIYGHHRFRILIGYDWLDKLGQGMFSAARNFLGKEISISITPMDTFGVYKPVIFNGLVTSVNTGKENDGTHGFCVIAGGSPTILLDDDPHITTFEQQPLQSIVTQSLKGTSPYTQTAVTPNHEENIKYTVQYKETTQQFITRMAARYGEWYFYDGQKIIFGKYTPQKVSLTHQQDLMDFDIALEVKSNNTRYSGYEYRQNIVVENSTGAQPASNMNVYVSHLKEVSEKLYRKPSLFKPNYGFSGNAKSQVDDLTSLQQRGRLSEMVVLSGSSSNTSLKIGDIVSINENAAGNVHHGEFLVTGLEHHCTENGDYHNTFTAIPADTAMPQVDLVALSGCEPQSATVTDNADPKGLGRIRVRFRWQQQGATPWLRMIAPHGGGNKGFYFIPEVNEEVWVAFEDGNPEAPYVLGTTYNGDAKTEFGDDQNNIKAIRTRSGHTIMLDDTSNGESITITDKNGNIITLDTSGKHIHITAPENLNLTAKNIHISAKENITMDAGKNVVTDAVDNIRATAGEEYAMKATNISGEAGDGISFFAQEDYKQTSGTMQLLSLLGDMKIIGSGTTVLQGNKKVKISRG